MTDDKNKNKKHATTETSPQMRDPAEAGQKKDEAQSEEVAHLKQKIEELENQVKRIFADYQNLEKRVTLERREWLIKANKDLILRLLPALDFLLLSVKHIEDEGLKLSIQKFFDILKEEGVEKIETVGKVFDPLVMECVETRVGEDWKVLEETRSGYKFGDMILRPAQVTVGKKEPSE